MRSFYLSLVLLLVGVCALFVSVPASADTILFSDGFESPLQSVTAGAVASGDANNLPSNPTVGTWGFLTTGTGRTAQVTNYATPGPATGSNYLRIMRDTIAPVGYIDADAGFTQQSTVGTKIRFEVDVYVPTAATGAVQLVGLDATAPGATGEKDLFNISATGASGQVRWYSGSAFTTLADIAYTAGVWQHWQVDYTLGNTTLDLTIGSTTKTGVGRVTAGTYATNGKVNYFMMTALNGAFDNVKVSLVPEPSAMALLASGLMGLLAYAWRRRR